MSGEQNMRQRVIKALMPLDAISVENSCGPGTPDVNFIGGWIELKRVLSWPAREDTPLRVPHFTRQQRVWLTKRVRRGGRAFMLIQVDRDWLLFNGAVAAEVLGTTPKAELITHAYRHWFPNLNEQELLDVLRVEED